MIRRLKYYIKTRDNTTYRETSCDGICNTCPVRFRCFTEPKDHILVLNGTEWTQMWYTLRDGLYHLNKEK